MGTAVSKKGEELTQLIDEGASRFRVHTDVYTDPQIFATELDRIFRTTWVFVAHDSEVANPGDYKTTHLGTQPIIVSRDEDGEIHVLFNRCRHRAALVARMPTGSANYFRCPYHGWVYSNDGKLTGIAQKKDAYPECFEQPWGLLRAPKVSSYRGLVFATLNPDAPTIEEHLGNARVWIDRQFNKSPHGTISLPHPPHVSEYEGNWKFQYENTVDGYHGDFVHESFWMVQERFGRKSGTHGAYVQGSVKEIKKLRQQGRAMGFENGHGLWNTPLASEGMDAMLEGPHAEYYRDLEKRYGREELQAMFGNINVIVYPNLGVLHGQLRVIRPISVERTEVAIYPFEIDGAPEAFNEERLRGYERFFGPSSFGSPDDVEIFAVNQEGLQAQEVGWLILERGMAREEIIDEVDRSGHVTDETPQRAFYRAWKRSMATETKNVGAVEGGGDA